MSNRRQAHPEVSYFRLFYHNNPFLTNRHEPVPFLIIYDREELQAPRGKRKRQNIKGVIGSPDGAIQSAIWHHVMHCLCVWLPMPNEIDAPDHAFEAPRAGS